MTDFAARARAALDAQGLSLRAAARELHFDVAYLSRVLNGKQTPSAQLAEGLDSLVGAGGSLAALAETPAPSGGDIGTPPGIADDITHMRATIDQVVAHDNRHGGDDVAPVAVRVWKCAQRRLDSGAVPEGRRRDYLASVAEVAEVAGWLLFDAGRQDECRAATLEAHMLARHAGDRSMERFTLTNLAMMGVEVGSPGESLRIVDELLSQPRVPPRVALLARIRRGRALASTGDHRRALDELGAARAALEDSVTPRDPAWTWWVNECELAGHEGEAHLALGDATAAVPKLERAAELAAAFRPDGRGVLYYRVSRVQAYTAAQAWRECGEELTALPPMLDTVSSGRNRRRLRVALRELNRHPDAPVWLTDLAHDVADVMRRQAA
ncbi:hypothetical protein BJF83_24830 [Nocardiopsis sp. CNR-923]|uniref:helix-turn-helix domain-containing protein n=1 Tax=Nocardiopsis sp. CNR-923 TaxID=1904965 RepID=UPI0009592B8D|nr:helix-turn-helix transcriptional regulator [Nocardiopsis sp. CNR-923]OLT30447.1 hypothetical protein BJF83_24830 [Nocardiopsis sp. CNR-923]